MNSASVQKFPRAFWALRWVPSVYKLIPKQYSYVPQVERCKHGIDRHRGTPRDAEKGRGEADVDPLRIFSAKRGVDRFTWDAKTGASLWLYLWIQSRYGAFIASWLLVVPICLQYPSLYFWEPFSALTSFCQGGLDLVGRLRSMRSFFFLGKARGIRKLPRAGILWPYMLLCEDLMLILSSYISSSWSFFSHVLSMFFGNLDLYLP